MIKWKYKLVLIPCLLLTTRSAWSEPATIGKEDVLSLRQAIDMAQRQNRSVLAARERVQSAQAKVREARGALLPQVNANASANQTNPFSPATAAPITPGAAGVSSFINSASGKVSTSSYQVQGTVSATLFAGFRIVDGLKVAQLGVEAATEDERSTRQDTVLNVTLSYFGVLQAQGVVDIARQSLRSAEAHLADAQKSLQAGVATRLDVLRAETQVYDFRQQLSKAELGVLTAQNNLNILLYRDLGTPLNLDPNADVPLLGMGLEQARMTTLQKRSELRRLRAVKRVDELTARIQDHATWPTITVNANVVHADANNTTGQRDTYGYGINLNWNAFDGLAAASRAAQSEANARADEHSIQQLQRSVAAEVEQNLQNITEARKRVAVTQKGMEAAQESLRLARRRYQAGVGTNTEVLDAQVALTQAQNNFNNARFDQEVAQAKFNRAVGREEP